MGTYSTPIYLIILVAVIGFLGGGIIDPKLSFLAFAHSTTIIFTRMFEKVLLRNTPLKVTRIIYFSVVA